jgi:DNA-binding GntR family transcriptional regulator
MSGALITLCTFGKAALKLIMWVIRRGVDQAKKEKDQANLDEDRRVVDAIRDGDTETIGQIIKKRKKYKSLRHE